MAYNTIFNAALAWLVRVTTMISSYLERARTTLRFPATIGAPVTSSPPISSLRPSRAAGTADPAVQSTLADFVFAQRRCDRSSGYRYDRFHAWDSTPSPPPAELVPSAVHIASLVAAVLLLVALFLALRRCSPWRAVKRVCRGPSPSSPLLAGLAPVPGVAVESAIDSAALLASLDPPVEIAPPPPPPPPVSQGVQTEPFVSECERELRTAIARQGAEMDQMGKELAKTRQGRSQAETDRRTLKEVVKKSQGLREKVDSLGTANDELSTAVASHVEEIGRLRKAATEQSHHAKSLQERLDALQAEHAKALTREQQAKDDKERAQQSARERFDRAKTLKAQLDTAQTELNTAQTALRTAQTQHTEESNRAQQAIKERNEAVAREQQANDNSNLAQQTAREQHDRANNVQSQLNTVQAQHTDEFNRAEQAIKERDEAVARERQLIEQGNAAVQNAVQNAQQTVEIERRRGEELQAQLNTVQGQHTAEHNRAEQAMKERDEAVARERQVIEEGNAAVQNAQQTAQQTVEAEHRRAEELQAQLNTVQGQHTDAFNHVQQANKERDEAVAREQQLMEQGGAAVREAQQAAEGLRAGNAELERRIEDLQTRHDSLQTRNEDLRTRHDSLEARNHDLQTRNASLETQNNALQESQYVQAGPSQSQNEATADRDMEGNLGEDEDYAQVLAEADAVELTGYREEESDVIDAVKVYIDKWHDLDGIRRRVRAGQVQLMLRTMLAEQQVALSRYALEQLAARLLPNRQQFIPPDRDSGATIEFPTWVQERLDLLDVPLGTEIPEEEWQESRVKLEDHGLELQHLLQQVALTPAARPSQQAQTSASDHAQGLATQMDTSPIDAQQRVQDDSTISEEQIIELEERLEETEGKLKEAETELEDVRSALQSFNRDNNDARSMNPDEAADELRRRMLLDSEVESIWRAYGRNLQALTGGSSLVTVDLATFVRRIIEFEQHLALSEHTIGRMADMIVPHRQPFHVPARIPGVEEDIPDWVRERAELVNLATFGPNVLPAQLRHMRTRIENTGLRLNDTLQQVWRASPRGLRQSNQGAAATTAFAQATSSATSNLAAATSSNRPRGQSNQGAAATTASEQATSSASSNPAAATTSNRAQQRPAAFGDSRFTFERSTSLTLPAASPAPSTSTASGSTSTQAGGHQERNSGQLAATPMEISTDLSNTSTIAGPSNVPRSTMAALPGLGYLPTDGTIPPRVQPPAQPRPHPTPSDTEAKERLSTAEEIARRTIAPMRSRRTRQGGGTAAPQPNERQAGGFVLATVQNVLDQLPALSVAQPSAVNLQAGPSSVQTSAPVPSQQAESEEMDAEATTSPEQAATQDLNVQGNSTAEQQTQPSAESLEEDAEQDLYDRVEREGW